VLKVTLQQLSMMFLKHALRQFTSFWLRKVCFNCKLQKKIGGAGCTSCSSNNFVHAYAYFTSVCRAAAIQQLLVQMPTTGIDRMLYRCYWCGRHWL